MEAIDMNDIEIVQNIPKSAILYHWGNEHDVEHMKDYGVTISNSGDSNYKMLDVDVNYSGLTNAYLFVDVPPENLRLMKVDFRKVMHRNEDSKCVLKEIDYDGTLGLVAEEGEECYIKPEDIQISQVFSNRWLKDNYLKNKIVIKFY